MGTILNYIDNKGKFDIEGEIEKRMLCVIDKNNMLTTLSQDVITINGHVLPTDTKRWKKVGNIYETEVADTIFTLEYKNNSVVSKDLILKTRKKDIESSNTSMEKNPNNNQEEINIEVDEFLLYETDKTKYSDSKGTFAEDLTSNDKSLSELLSVPSIKNTMYELIETHWSTNSNYPYNYSESTSYEGSWNTKEKTVDKKWFEDSKYSKETENILWNEFEELIKLTSTNELEKVGLDMINTFKNNKTTYKKEYENSILTKKVREHYTTKEFVKNIKTSFEKLISDYLNEIKDKGDKEKKELLTKHKDIKSFINKTSLPKFSDEATWNNNKKISILTNGFDLLKGLTILIDTIWSAQVYVKSLKIKGNKISYTLHFEIYDHFGLDAKDITGLKELHNGFASWYILQHYDKFEYTPFITKISFDEKISDKI